LINAPDQITRTEKPTTASQTAPKAEVDFLKWLMVGVVLVLGIAVGGFLTTSMAAKQAAYEDLRDKVVTQSDKIDSLTRALQDEQQASRDAQKALQEINDKLGK